MLKFYEMLKTVLSRNDGQDLVEYALITSLIGLACISGVGSFGVVVAGMVSTLAKAAAEMM